MGKLETILARMGYVKLDRYGLYLNPEGRIVTTEPRVLDDGSGNCVVGWKPGDPAETMFPVWQGKPASPANPGAATPPPAVALAKLALAEAGKSTKPTMPPPPVPRAQTPTRPPPVVVIPPVEAPPAIVAPPSTAPVATANPEVEDDEDEWEWQMALARARAAAEEAERAVVAGPPPKAAAPAPTPAPTPALRPKTPTQPQAIAPTQPVPRPRAGWVPPDSTPVPKKAADIPRVAAPTPAASAMRPTDPLAPVVRSSPLPGVHAARLAAAKSSPTAKLPHAPPADRPVSDDTVRTTAIGEDTVRTTAVAEALDVGDSTTRTRAAPPPPKKPDRSSAPTPPPTPAPISTTPSAVIRTVIPVPQLPVANATQRSFEPVVRSRAIATEAAPLPPPPRARLARGTDRVDGDEITNVGAAPLPRITTRLARR
jgi:hypothetical protein